MNSTETTSLAAQPTALDSPRSLLAIVYLAVIGPCVFILQPGFVQGLIEYVGYDEVQSANIVAAEMFAIALSTIVLNFILHRINWRQLALCYLLLATVGNLLSTLVIDQTYWLIATRFLAGLGAGGLISITFTMMGLTRLTDRNFGFIIMAVLTYGGFGILAMPWLYHTVGMVGVLLLFALFCASGLLFITHLPAGSTVLHSEDNFTHHIGIGGVVLAAVLLYNIGIGLVWVYLFAVGIDAGIEEQQVANALTVSQFLGIAGAFTAVLLQNRFGRLIPLLIGVIAGAAGIYFVVGKIDGGLYWLGVCLFNFMWNMAMPYILALLSTYHQRGNFVTYGVSMQLIGYAVGPFLAGLIVSDYGFDGVNLTAIVLFVASAVLFIPALLAAQAKDA